MRPVIFHNREHAGELLAEMLESFHKSPDTVVIGLPRGGVVTAFAVAKALKLPLDIVCPRKVGAPGNPEYAIGAVTESGETILNERVITAMGVNKELLHKIIEYERDVARARLELYRKGLPAQELKNKEVIIVDDGMATGHTMKAAIKSVRAQKPKRVIVAIPVTPQDTAKEISPTVDELFYYQAPAFFAAVGQFYEEFLPTTDEEVIYCLQQHSTH